GHAAAARSFPTRRSSDLVECRVWSWQGQDFTTPPRGLLVDALLRAYGTESTPEPGTAEAPFELPEDMKRFFAARQDAGSRAGAADRKSTRLNSSHVKISY